MVVTAETTSRLEDLRKYTVTTVFSDKYFTSGTINNNGVDLINSDSSTQIIYYIDGIKFVDIISGTSIYSGYTGGTTLSIYTPQGITTDNFIFKQYYKDPLKEEVSSNVKISDDVFIDRQEVAVFENNYRLEFISGIANLESYAGGLFFNIVKNT
jgi:hypothetical protein